MTKAQAVQLVFTAWDDSERVLAGITEQDATRAIGGGSSFAWTLGHMSNLVDAWINVRFQGRTPHLLISQPDFRIGGSGIARDWQAIYEGTQEVRQAARVYLETLNEEDLDLTIPYDGSVASLRATGLRLRDALLLIANHDYYHIGEIAAKRSFLGHDVGDLPTAFWER